MKLVGCGATRAGVPLDTLTGHTDAMSEVVFSPDGAQLASSGDRTARTWDPPRWVNPTPETVCDAVHCDLSKQEWNLYLPGGRLQTSKQGSTLPSAACRLMMPMPYQHRNPPVALTTRPMSPGISMAASASASFARRMRT